MNTHSISAFASSSMLKELIVRMKNSQLPGIVSADPKSSNLFNVLLQSNSQRETIDVSSSSSVYIDGDSSCIHDPLTNTIAYATNSKLGSFQVTSPINSVISLNSESITYITSDKLIAQHTFVNDTVKVQEATVIGYSAKPPIIFDGGWYAGGILALGGNYYPVDLLLSDDPTLPRETTFSTLIYALDSYLIDLGKDVKSYIGLKSIADDAKFRKNSLSFAGDLSGRYLYIGFSGLSEKADAVVVDLQSYMLSRGAGFFSSASAIKLSANNPDVTLQVLPKLGSFLLHSSNVHSSSLYIVDNRVLANGGIETITALSRIKSFLPIVVSQGNDFDSYVSIANTSTLYRIRSESKWISKKLTYKLSGNSNETRLDVYSDKRGNQVFQKTNTSLDLNTRLSYSIHLQPLTSAKKSLVSGVHEFDTSTVIKVAPMYLQQLEKMSPSGDLKRFSADLCTLNNDATALRYLDGEKTLLSTLRREFLSYKPQVASVKSRFIR